MDELVHPSPSASDWDSLSESSSDSGDNNNCFLSPYPNTATYKTRHDAVEDDTKPITRTAIRARRDTESSSGFSETSSFSPHFSPVGITVGRQFIGKPGNTSIVPAKFRGSPLRIPNDSVWNDQGHSVVYPNAYDTSSSGRDWLKSESCDGNNSLEEEDSFFFLQNKLNVVAAPPPPAFRDSQDLTDLEEVKQPISNKAYRDSDCSSIYESAQSELSRGKTDDHESVSGSGGVPAKRTRLHSATTNGVESSWKPALITSEPVQFTSARKLTQRSTEEFPVFDILWSYDDNVFCNKEFAQSFDRVFFTIFFHRFYFSIFDGLCASERARSIGLEFMKVQRKGYTEQKRRELVLMIMHHSRRLCLTNETIHLAVYMLDKCLDSFHVSADVAKDMAAVILVITSKLEEYQSLRLSEVVSAGMACSQSVSQLAAIEKQVLGLLDYSLSFATPFIYANYFHTILRSDRQQICLANYYLELCLLESAFRDYGGSHVAHAAVVLANTVTATMRGASCDIALRTAELELSQPSRISPGATRPIIVNILTNVNITNLVHKDHPVWNLYNTPEMSNVSNLSVPKDLLQYLNDDENDDD